MSRLAEVDGRFTGLEVQNVNEAFEPKAKKADDSDKLGGHAASDYVLATGDELGTAHLTVEDLQLRKEDRLFARFLPFFNQPALFLYDKNTKPKLLLSVDGTNSGRVSLFDTAFKLKALLQLDGDENGQLTLGAPGVLRVNGENGQPNVILGEMVDNYTGGEDRGAVKVYNKSGQLRAQLGVGGYVKDGLLDMRGRDGRKSVRIGFGDSASSSGGNSYPTEINSSSGRGRIILNNSKGDPMIRLVNYSAYSSVTDDALIELFGADDLGQIVQLGVKPDNSGYLVLESSDERKNVELKGWGSGNTNGWVGVHSSMGSLRGALRATTATGSLALYGSNGKSNVSVSALGANNNYGGIWCLDDKGDTGASIGIKENGNGFVFTRGTLLKTAFDHPDDPDSDILYSGLLGSSEYLLHHGRVTLSDGQASVDLPDHYIALIDPLSMTVHPTPVSADSRGVGIAAIRKEGFDLVELDNGRGNYDIHFLVVAHAKNADPDGPVQSKAQVKAKYAGKPESENAGE